MLAFLGLGPGLGFGRLPFPAEPAAMVETELAAVSQSTVEAAAGVVAEAAEAAFVAAAEVVEATAAAAIELELRAFSLPFCVDAG